VRVLLDECVPRGLRDALPGHDLLTVDRSLEYQQSFFGLALAVIVIEAPSNDIAVLRPLMPAVLEAMDACRPGVVTRVHA
jgi:hypothetical protein